MRKHGRTQDHPSIKAGSFWRQSKSGSATCRHVKMTKQSQVIVERQRLTVFAYPNLSHFKPTFVHKNGFLVTFRGYLRGGRSRQKAVYGCREDGPQVAGRIFVNDK